jgi:hypothetical protein
MAPAFAGAILRLRLDMPKVADDGKEDGGR